MAVGRINKDPIKNRTKDQKLFHIKRYLKNHGPKGKQMIGYRCKISRNEIDDLLKELMDSRDIHFEKGAVGIGYAVKT